MPTPPHAISFSRPCKFLQVGGVLAILLALILWGGEHGKSKYLGISFGGIASIAFGTLGQAGVWLVRRTKRNATASELRVDNATK